MCQCLDHVKLLMWQVSTVQELKITRSLLIPQISPNGKNIMDEFVL